MVDVDSYFERIGYSGSTSPTFDVLADLLVAHMRAIPFENLDVLLHRLIRLDIEGLQAKLVKARRGGYCFEQATLLASMLERLGFSPTAHAARVLLRAPRREVARTHMFLTVALDDVRYVIDPGFGALAPQEPLPLAAQASGDHTHWMALDGDWWIMRAKSEGRVVDCWASTLEHENAMDFVLANHFTSTHPASPFVNHLMLRALTPDGRVSVMNREVTHVSAAGSTSRQLADRAALRDLLQQHFGFDLPEALALHVPTLPEWP